MSPPDRDFERVLSALLDEAGTSFEGIARAIDELDHPSKPDPLVLALFKGYGKPYLDFIERVQLRLEQALDDLRPVTVEYRGAARDGDNVTDELVAWLRAVRLDYRQAKARKKPARSPR